MRSSTALIRCRLCVSNLFGSARWFLLLLLLSLSACSSQPEIPLAQAIVGDWINAQNYTISFYADGTGFAPGVDGEIPIPATDFSYVITDANHIQITTGDLAGAMVEISIEGDQMTWVNEDANLRFIYTRSP